MMTLLRLFTVVVNLLAATTLAKPLYKPRRSQTIQWGPCDFPSLNTRPIECGSVSVPLDYTDPTSNETLTLALIKSPAVAPAPTKKSILFNFGGPGYEAMQSLNAVADLLHKYHFSSNAPLIANNANKTQHDRRSARPRSF